MKLDISDQARRIAGLLTIALVVYLAPAAILQSMAPDSATSALFTALLVINPLLNFVLGAFYAWRYGPWMLFPVFTAAVFLPAVYIVYNESALIYGALYLVAGFVGLGLGALVRRAQQPQQD